jgi:hypothetical protein
LIHQPSSHSHKKPWLNEPSLFESECDAAI